MNKLLNMSKVAFHYVMCICVALALISTLCLPTVAFASESTYGPSTVSKNIAAKGIVYTGVATSNTSETLSVDFNAQWISGYNDTGYNAKVAQWASLLSGSISDGVTLKIDNTTYTTNTCKEFLKAYGFKNIEIINITSPDGKDTDDIATIAIAQIDYSIGDKTFTTYACTIGATSGSDEWTSNLDFGADSTNYSSDRTTEHPQWTNVNNHKGFDVAATRVDKAIANYISTHQSTSTNKSIFLTGFSRGASIANILGAAYDNTNGTSCGVGGYGTGLASGLSPVQMNSSAYCFSPARVTKASTTNQKSVYSLVNANDFVSLLPLESWGYKYFGKTITTNVQNSTDIKTYLSETFGVSYQGITDFSSYLNAFSQIASSSAGFYEDFPAAQYTPATYSSQTQAQAFRDAFKSDGVLSCLADYITFDATVSVTDTGKYYWGATVNKQIALAYLAKVVSDAQSGKDVTSFVMSACNYLNFVTLPQTYSGASSTLGVSLTRIALNLNSQMSYIAYAHALDNAYAVANTSSGEYYLQRPNSTYPYLFVSPSQGKVSTGDICTIYLNSALFPELSTASLSIVTNDKTVALTSVCEDLVPLELLPSDHSSELILGRVYSFVMPSSDCALKFKFVIPGTTTTIEMPIQTKNESAQLVEDSQDTTDNTDTTLESSNAQTTDTINTASSLAGTMVSLDDNAQLDIPLFLAFFAGVVVTCIVGGIWIKFFLLKKPR